MLRNLSVVFLLSVSALACSFFPPVYKVSRSFSVRVKNDMGVVTGIKIKVTRLKIEEFDKLTDEQQRSIHPDKLEKVIAEAATDDSGLATFNLARTGHFTLSPETPACQLCWVEIEVSDQATSPTVDLQWPSSSILATQQLRGTLMKGLYSSRDEPIKNNDLRLHTLVGYKEVSATATYEDGTFEFKDVAPGLYFLEIVATAQKTKDFYRPEGNIPVYLGPNSQNQHLEISTANTSCGLMYDLKQNKSRYKPEACFKGGKPVKCGY